MKIRWLLLGLLVGTFLAMLCDTIRPGRAPFSDPLFWILWALSVVAVYRVSRKHVAKTDDSEELPVVERSFP